MTEVVALTLLVVTAAPVPAGPLPDVGPVDGNQAAQFAWVVDQLVQQIARSSAREVSESALIEGAIRRLHDEVGLAVPEGTLAAIRKGDLVERPRILREARIALGNHPKLQG